MTPTIFQAQPYSAWYEDTGTAMYSHNPNNLVLHNIGQMSYDDDDDYKYCIHVY